MSASQVIKQYEKDFSNTADYPLLNFQVSLLYLSLWGNGFLLLKRTLFQVGHFMRKIFPSIERCKITHHGRRIWVYKHLCVVDGDKNQFQGVSSENPKPKIREQGNK